MQFKPFITALDCSSFEFGERGNHIIDLSYCYILSIVILIYTYTPIYTSNTQKYPTEIFNFTSLMLIFKFKLVRLSSYVFIHRIN